MRLTVNREEVLILFGESFKFRKSNARGQIGYVRFDKTFGKFYQSVSIFSNYYILKTMLGNKAGKVKRVKFEGK